MMIPGFFVLALGSSLLSCHSPSIIDGDTLICGDRVRLVAIDAPELHGIDAEAGAQSKRALIEMTRGRSVICRPEGHDRYGRTVGACFINEQSIGCEMVKQGYARAWIRYGRCEGNKPKN